MCLMMLALPGASPSREELENACRQNPNGFGFAFRINDKTIKTGRSMNSRDAIDRYFQMSNKYPNAFSLFHARYATHGVLNRENCHPFRVGGTRSMVLAHNGIMAMDLPVNGARSDSRIFAEDILPAMGIKVLDQNHNLAFLEDWLGSDKLVVLSVHPGLRDPYYIVNESYGHWDDDKKPGIWWSNYGYVSAQYKYKYSTTYIGTPSEEDFEADEIDRKWWLDRTTDTNEYKCPMCDTILSADGLASRSCSNCSSCIDCENDIEQCSCDGTVHEDSDDQLYRMLLREEEERQGAMPQLSETATSYDRRPGIGWSGNQTD